MRRPLAWTLSQKEPENLPFALTKLLRGALWKMSQGGDFPNKVESAVAYTDTQTREAIFLNDGAGKVLDHLIN